MQNLPRLLRSLSVTIATCAIIVTATLAAETAPTTAPAPTGFSRKVLLDHDLVQAGHHGVIALIEFAVGGAAGRHTHPGDEMGYVVEGSVQLEIDGKAAQVFKTGDTFFIAGGTIHTARNAGTTPAKIVSSYFVEKGQPLATPAKVAASAP